MATAEHREPCESRGSCTVLGAPGGGTPPGDSTKADTRSSRAFGIGVGIGIGGFLKKMLEEPFDAFTFSTGRSVGLSAGQLRDGNPEAAVKNAK